MTGVTPNLPHCGNFCKYCFMGTLLWGTPCCTYRYRLWSFAGCVRRAHPVFYFVLILLTHGSQPYFSNILPARRLESNLHTAILFGIRRAFPDLAFDGFFALIVAGIAGVDYSGHRRASLRSGWGWMSPYCISYNIYHILCPIARLLSAVWWCSF